MAGEHNCEESHKSIFSHWLSKSLWPIIEMSSTFVFRIKLQIFLDVVVRPLATLTIGKIGADVDGELRWG